jgi:hypothetical protein
VFCYFLRDRRDAAGLVSICDEIDHLGLFLRHGRYSSYLQRVSAQPVRCVFSYRDEIDKYYHAVTAGDSPLKRPSPPANDAVLSIARELGRAGRRGCRRAGLYLLSMDRVAQDCVERLLRDIPERQVRCGRLLPGWTGGLTPLLLLYATPDIPVPEKAWLRRYALTWLITAGADELLVLCLQHDGDGQLTDVTFRFFTKGDIGEAERPELESLAKLHAEARVADQIAHAGAIGRNELCPCGSGRKHKRCCGKPRV